MSLPSLDTDTHDSPPRLPYVFQFGSSDPCTQSVLWLHGATGSHHQFPPLLPLFPPSKYHHLLLDLPSHGIEVTGDFSYPKALDQICLAIQRYAHPGRCHIVGFSLGGTVALSLIRNRPQFVEERVGKVFVTGATLVIPRWMGVFFWFGIPFTRIYLELFRFGWFTHWFETVIGMKWSDPLIQDMKRWNSLSRFFGLGRKALDISPVADNGKGEVIDVELCLCLGSKEPMAKRIAQGAGVMRTKVKVCRSYVALGMAHMWDAQEPGLFVETVERFFEGKGPPTGIVPMEEYYDVQTGRKRKR